MNDIILYQSQDPLAPKPAHRLVKVPDKVYEIMCDLARLQGHTLKQCKDKVLKLLMDWALDRYPGQVIINFVDYSADEAAIIGEKTGYDIRWGMYILLGDGSYEETTVEQTLMDNPNQNTQLTNNLK